jgi:hypothetical protein
MNILGAIESLWGGYLAMLATSLGDIRNEQKADADIFRFVLSFFIN